MKHDEEFRKQKHDAENPFEGIETGMVEKPGSREHIDGDGNKQHNHLGRENPEIFSAASQT